MRKCDVCGTKISFNATHCPNCGKQYKATTQIRTSISKEKKRQINFEHLRKIVGLIIAIISLYYSLSSLITSSQPTPNDYFVNQYGEDYDMLEFVDFYIFQQQYPELSLEIQPYYQLATQRRSYERYSETSTPTGTDQTHITIVNDQIHSLAFEYYIRDDYKDVNVFYTLRRMDSHLWNEHVRVDCYNIKKEDLTSVIKAHLDYIEEILEIDMKNEINYILGKTDNYYKSINYDSTIEDYMFEFNYNANGDFYVNMHRTLND